MYIELCSGYYLRSFKTEDALSLSKYADNQKIAEKLRDVFPSPYTFQDAADWIALAISSEPQAHFAIATDDECIGCIGLTLQEDIFSHSAELGFWIGEPFWNKGITTLASKEIIRYAFDELFLSRVFAYTFCENFGSRKVLEKCNMLLEGKLVKGIRKNNVFHDVVLYAITK